MKNLETIQNIADVIINDEANEEISADLEKPEEKQRAAEEDLPDCETLKKMIAEAEMRGYERGREETLKLYEDENRDEGENWSEPVPTFLSHLRPGFWD